MLKYKGKDVFYSQEFYSRPVLLHCMILKTEGKCPLELKLICYSHTAARISKWSKHYEEALAERGCIELFSLSNLGVKETRYILSL